jgi:integrase/recombinase XerD
MHSQGYADRNVFKRVPVLCQFADFAREAGATDLISAGSKVEDFATHWAEKRVTNCKTAQARLKLLSEARNPIRQMLVLPLEGRIAPERQHKPFPFEAGAPRFRAYLQEERGVRESTIHHYAHRLNCFSRYLEGLGVASLKELSPALLASFIVDTAPKLSRSGRRDLCGELRVFLRFCYRERIVVEELSAAVEMPQVYRLAGVLRSIRWDEVRRMLAMVDRRTAAGRRDYAMLLLLVTYGLRADEVVKLTLDDIDWRRERFLVPERKAGHATAYPLAGVVAQGCVKVPEV